MDCFVDYRRVFSDKQPKGRRRHGGLVDQDRPRKKPGSLTTFVPEPRQRESDTGFPAGFSGICRISAIPSVVQARLSPPEQGDQQPQA